MRTYDIYDIARKALAVCLIPIYAEALRKCWEIYRQRPVTDPWRKLKPKAAIALAQSPATAAYTTSASARTVASSSNVTAGNLMVLVLGGFSWSNANIPTVMDGLGNDWQTVSNFGNASGSLSPQLFMYYALNITGGACTVTVTPQVSTYITMCLLEYSGADKTVGPQSTRQGNGTSSTPDCGTIPISWANSLVIAAYAQGASGASATQGSGYTLEYNQSNASFEQLYVQDKTGVSSSTATSLTLSASETWFGGAVSFRPAQSPSSTITIVQSKGKQKFGSNASSLAFALDSTVTSGNCLAAVVGGIPATTATYTVSDNVNGAWTQGITFTSGSNQPQSEIWIFPNTGSGTVTVTLATSATSLLSMAVMELSGVLTSNPIDNTGSHNATSTSATTGAVAIVANAIAIGAICTEQTDDDEINPESGWTNVYSHGSGTSALAWASCCGIGAQTIGDQANNSAGSLTATWTTYDGVHDNYTATFLSLKAGNPPPAASPHINIVIKDPTDYLRIADLA